jgi:hypothetical protein
LATLKPLQERNHLDVRIALVLACAFSPVFAVTLKDASWAEMTSMADVIVAARIVSSASEATAEPGMHGVQTRVRLDQVRALKGKCAQSLDVILPGGTDGAQRIRVPGTPEFLPDENVVLFLRDSEVAPTEFYLCSYGMGVLREHNGLVVPDLSVMGGPTAGGESAKDFFARFGAATLADSTSSENSTSPHSERSRIPLHLLIAFCVTLITFGVALFRRRRRAACIIVTTGALLGAALGSPPHASAGVSSRDGFTYVLDGPKWDLNNNLAQHVSGGRILWFPGKGSRSLTDSDAFSAITQSFQRWEDVPTSAVAFRQAGLSADAGSADEGRNVISFLAKPPHPTFDSNTLAITYLLTDATGTFYRDTDTAFNDRDITWVASGARYSLDVVSTHEIGHILGLGHSTNTADVMYPVAQGVVNLSDSDKAGAAALYPLNTLVPPASAFACPRLGISPLTVFFSSDGSNPGPDQPLAVQWDFGDGTPLSSEVNPTHVYASPGTFTATLKLTASPTVPPSQVLIRVAAPAADPVVKTFQFKDALIGSGHSDKVQLILDNIDFAAGDSPAIMIGGVSITASSSPQILNRARVTTAGNREGISGKLKLSYNTLKRELSMNLTSAALRRTFDFRDPNNPAQSGTLTEPLALSLTHTDGTITVYATPLTFSFTVKSGNSKNGFFEKTIQGKK